MRESSVSSQNNVLTSPAVGSGMSDLITPCTAPRPDRAEPPPVAEGRTPLAVTLSGGGFRATLAGLGVLRFLADAELLQDVRWISSVSGGSVANGILAVALPGIRAGEFSRESLDELLIGPFVDQISTESLLHRLIRNAWRLIGPTSRTELLAEELDELFLHKALLEDIDAGLRFIFNAANLSTGVRFGFEREVVGDYVVGQLPTAGTAIGLSTAVAASAAVPGLFSALTPKGLPSFPCQGERPLRLVDGGAYDNMGLEPVDNLRESFLVSLNAGGVFVTGQYGHVPVLRDLQLANSLLYRQSTSLRRREMVDRFHAYEALEDPETGKLSGSPPAWGRHGVLFGLSTTFNPDEARVRSWRSRNPEEPVVETLARVHTSFDRFDRRLCRDLIHAGWWLTGASIAAFHRHLLPDPSTPPAWSEPW